MCQSGFLLVKTCVSQWLSFVNDTNSSFDCDPTVDVKHVFLDICKTFDKVSHKGLLYKLEIFWIKRDVLNFPHNYLHKRFRKAVPKIFTWKYWKFGGFVTRGFVLASLMFL